MFFHIFRCFSVTRTAGTRDEPPLVLSSVLRVLMVRLVPRESLVTLDPRETLVLLDPPDLSELLDLR